MSSNQPAPYAAVDQPNTPQAPAQMGFGTRLANVLFSPSEVFADVNRAPKPVVPLLVFLLVVLVSGFFVQWRLQPDWRGMAQAQVEQELARQGKVMNDLSEQERRAVEMQIKGTAWIGPYFPIVAVIILLIVLPVIALLFWGGTLLMQSEATYPKVFSVVTWSMLGTGIVSALIAVLGTFLRSGESINFLQGEGVISTNLSPLVSATANPVLHTLLTRLDVFTIWILILSSIGLAAVSRKKTTAQMAVIPFGLWGLYVVFTVVVAVIRS